MTKLNTYKANFIFGLASTLNILKMTFFANYKVAYCPRNFVMPFKITDNPLTGLKRIVKLKLTS